MKSKILHIILVILIIVACGTTYIAFNAYSNYHSNNQKTPTKEKERIDRTATQLQDDNEISEQMGNAIFTLSFNVSEYSKYMKNMDFQGLPTQHNKDDIIRQIMIFKENIDGVTTFAITSADEDFEDLLFHYQATASSWIQYMMTYIETGDKRELTIHNLFLKDIKEYNRQMVELGEKHELTIIQSTP